MALEFREHATGVEWAQVADILKAVGMASYTPELHRRAFLASPVTCFVFDGGELIGVGRAISDGAYQAAVYDCAVREEFQGQGIGKRIVRSLLARLPGCNVILYAAPGKERFYEKLGFRKMTTGMALFNNAAAMRERGFTE